MLIQFSVLRLDMSMDVIRRQSVHLDVSALARYVTGKDCGRRWRRQSRGGGRMRSPRGDAARLRAFNDDTVGLQSKFYRSKMTGWMAQQEENYRFILRRRTPAPRLGWRVSQADKILVVARASNPDPNPRAHSRHLSSTTRERRRETRDGSARPGPTCGGGYRSVVLTGGGGQCGLRALEDSGVRVDCVGGGRRRFTVHDAHAASPADPPGSVHILRQGRGAPQPLPLVLLRQHD